ncbi:MAG: ribulose-phosphate 3-epimerase [Acidimicrobiales bacterium]
MSDSERSRRVSIAPSILSADFAELARDVECVAAQTDLLHVDVMDGHFVPNLTIGPPVVAALRRHSRAYLDCHLMITDPADYLEAFASAGASGCSVHVEVGQTESLIAQMRDLGLDAGLAVNPETPFEVFAPFLGQVDLVLLMTVHPGFGGQSFMAEVLPKIARTAAALEAGGHPAVLQVDGGIDPDTAPLTSEAGARAFVAGSAIFGRDDPLGAAAALRRAVGGEGAARPWHHPGDA